MSFSSTNGSHLAVNRAGGRLLGFASLGVGLAELLMPRKIERWLGIGSGQHIGILRILGIRELSHALDILSHEDPAPGVTARVAGDMLDGALFAIAGTKSRRPGGYASAAILLAGITLLDLVVAKRLSRD